MDPRIIVKKLEILSEIAVQETGTIGPWQGRAAKHSGPGRYEYIGDWQPVPDYSQWPALQTIFLRAPLNVPDDPENRFIVFSFDAMEGLVSIGERPWAGIDRGHRRIPVPSPGEHELLVELISVPRAWAEPGLRGSFGTFRGARLVRIDPDVHAAYYDFRFIFETVNALPDGRRKELLDAALEDAMVAINLAAPREQVLAEISAARDLLAQRVAEIAPDPEGGRLFLTGHTHIDTAWLWPISETIRKCARTFSTACRLMERYPGYYFSCSQAQLFKYTKEHYPALFEEIRRWVAEGRWETTGAMWVETDTNVPSGESLIRQILHGLRFFREEFGTRPTLCWLPDAFGYNAAMPQILVGCGLRSFWTWKLHWQSRNPFPYHLFWWEGIDGTKILAHIPKLGGGGYNGNPTPEQLARAWDSYAQKGTYDEQLFPFGYGDGGGGVNDEMLEFAARAARAPGLPACRQGTAEQFFEYVHQAQPELPTWTGELYLETHRGTYTTQGHTKQGNRRCELALREAEIWSVVQRCVAAEDTSAPPELSDIAETLRDAWEKVLLHQFHDILPGSSIAEVYEDTARDHAEVLRTAQAIRDTSLDKLAQRREHSVRFRVFNSLSWQRNDVARATIPDLGNTLVAVSEGRRLPAQVLSRSSGWADVVFLVRQVPSMGAATVEISDAPTPENALRCCGRTMESNIYLLELAEDGSIARLLDKRRDREVIPRGQNANRLQLFQDGPEREAAWNVHATYSKREYPWEGDCTIQVVEQGPVRAVVRVTRTHRDTRLEQDIILYDGLPRIDFRTRVDWHERQTMLKVAFPVNVHTAYATYEVQFGAYERPTYRNTSWEQEKFEVCGLRWVDLSEAGYGVSLLNDSKYGHDVSGNVMRLTLLRGTEYPDPQADQGLHEFTYSLLPHVGDWREGETVHHAAQLNTPLIAVPAPSVESAISYITVSGPAILDTVKPADNGDGVILRLYEPHGARGQVTVQHRLPFASVVACNLVEEDQEAVPAAADYFSFDITPFQIRTFRLH